MSKRFITTLKEDWKNLNLSFENLSKQQQQWMTSIRGSWQLKAAEKLMNRFLMGEQKKTPIIWKLQMKN